MPQRVVRGKPGLTGVPGLASGHRSSSARPDTHRKMSIDRTTAYGRTFLVLVARDPWSLHAFWEVSTKDIKRKNGSPRPSSLVLRMYEIDTEKSGASTVRHFFDTSVDSRVGDWDFNLWRDGGTYFGQLGWIDSKGMFVATATSNEVQTPRANQSNRTDVIWMDPGRPQPHNTFLVLPSESTKQSRDQAVFLTKDFIRDYYTKFYVPENLARLASTLPRAAAPEGEFASWNTSPLPVYQGQAADVTGSGSQFGGASERLVDEFSFSLDTTLEIRGHARPGTRIFWQDREIVVRQDGTFTLRIPLAPGTVPLDFSAVSANGKERRVISTRVIREQTRHEHLSADDHG